MKGQPLGRDRQLGGGVARSTVYNDGTRLELHCLELQRGARLVGLEANQGDG